MKLRVADIVNDSIVDGPGLRLAVFFQGCRHCCPECHNPQTWDAAGGRIVSLASIVDMYKKNPLLSGITLTGGEPFLQAEGAAVLAEAVHKTGGNVITYTGYTWEELQDGSDSYRALIQQTDFLIDGPYKRELRSLELPFRGSANQRIIDVGKTNSARKIQLADWGER